MYSIAKAFIAVLGVQGVAGAGLRGETGSCPTTAILDFNATHPGTNNSAVSYSSPTLGKGYNEDSKSCFFVHPSTPGDNGTVSGNLYAQTPAYCVYNVSAMNEPGFTLVPMTTDPTPCK